MKFLSKLGKIVLAVGAQASGFAPILKAALPDAGDAIVDRTVTTLDDLNQIIVTVEVAGQALELKGAQKLQAAVPLVRAGLMGSALVRQRGIANPDLAEQGARKVADGLADFLNSLKEP